MSLIIGKIQIIELLKGIAFSVANIIANDETNPYGFSPKNTAEINNIARIKSNIINDRITDVIGKIENPEILSVSFLSTMPAESIRTKNYDGIDKRIADIILTQINITKNDAIPTINQITKEITDAVAEENASSMSYMSRYNIIYFNDNPVLNILMSTSELNPYEYEQNISNLYLSAVVKEEQTLSKIKEYLYIGNPTVDTAIDKMLSARMDEYWIKLYNEFFTDIRESNTRLSGISKRTFDKVDDTVFLYLVARNFSKTIPYTINTTKENWNGNFNMLLNFLGKSLGIYGVKLNNIRENSKIIIDGYSSTDIIIYTKTFKDSGLSIETVIGAMMDNIYTLDNIKLDIKKYTSNYNNANALFEREKEKKRKSVIYNAYSDALTKNLSGDKVYDANRVKIHDKLFEKDYDSLSNIRKNISKILYKTKYAYSNVEAIIDYASRYNNNSTDDIDFDEIMGYVILELVCDYLVCTHVKSKG